MFLGTLCYAVYIGSFLAVEIAYGSDTKTTLIATFIITAAMNGFGAAMLWVAQGKYISQCASEENKGIFNGIFWAFYQASQVLGNVIGAFILGYFT